MLRAFVGFENEVVVCLNVYCDDRHLHINSVDDIYTFVYRSSLAAVLWVCVLSQDKSTSNSFAKQSFSTGFITKREFLTISSNQFVFV